jgi:hypothetical protein
MSVMPLLSLVYDSQKKDNKALYTSGSCEEKGGYVITYANLQELHALDAKIQRAKAAVQSCIDIGVSCLLHTRKHVAAEHSTSEDGAEEFLLEVHQQEMRRRLASLQELEDQMIRTLRLVSLSYLLTYPSQD